MRMTKLYFYKHDGKIETVGPKASRSNLLRANVPAIMIDVYDDVNRDLREITTSFPDYTELADKFRELRFKQIERIEGFLAAQEKAEKFTADADKKES